MEFSEFGFEGTTVRRVGKRADVDFTLITYYFGTKENLWKEVMFNGLNNFSNFIKEFESSEKAVTEGQKIRRFFKASLYYASSPSNTHALAIFRELIGNTDRATWMIEHIDKYDKGNVFDLIPIAQANGELCKGNPRLLYFSLMLSARTLCLNKNAYTHFGQGDTITTKATDEMWAILDQTYFSNVIPASSSVD